MAFSFSSHECCGSPLVPRQYIVTFSGILSALSVSLCGGILPNLLEPVIESLKGEDWEILGDTESTETDKVAVFVAGELHWGSCRNMASQLLLEGCVDAWCFFSVADLFDWRNIRITRIETSTHHFFQRVVSMMHKSTAFATALKGPIGLT